MTEVKEITEHLTIRERAVLFHVLPAEGDVTTLRMVRKLREALAFSEEESAEWGIRTEGTQIHWDPMDPEPLTAIAMGPKAKEIISDALKALNAAKRLRDDHLDLYDRFVGDGQ